MKRTRSTSSTEVKTTSNVFITLKALEPTSSSEERPTMTSNLQKKMNIERSIYEILQIVSVSLTDSIGLKDLFAKPNYNIVNEQDGSDEPTLF